MRGVSSIRVLALNLLEIVVLPLVETFFLFNCLPQVDDVMDQLNVHVHDAEVVFLVDRSFHLQTFLK